MKKAVTVLLLTVFLVLPICTKTKAQNPNSRETSPLALGIALKASTNGLGGDLVFNFHKRMSLRLGYEGFSYGTSYSFEEGDLSYDADIDLKIGSTSLLFDFYLFRIFFLSAGAGLNAFHVNVEGEPAQSLPFGDIEISPDMIGDFSIQMDPTNRISPYLGIGIGRTLSLEKKVSVAFELGGFYQGPIDITLNSAGLLAPTSNPEHGQEERLEHQIDQYTWWPVVKLSVAYRIVNF